jgi:alkylated DNA repair protein alkB family protein 8
MDLDIQNVYDNIAKDFDRTRYKIWPEIKKFINNLDSNSLVGDIGCGNGKNMLPIRKDLIFKGIDLSL